MRKFYSKGQRIRASLVGTVLLALGLTRPATAQTYSMPVTGTAAYTTCGGTLYDDGGASNSYSANADGVVTLTPATAGNKIQLQFTTFSVESGYDRLYIYDGSSTTAPLIGTYEGQALPSAVYATNSAGTLTLRFTSDYTAQYAGFAANIACVTAVPQADLAIQGASVQPLAPVAGNTLTTSCTIYNLASASATSSSVGYYLSADATLDASDALLGSTSGGALGAGQSAYRSASVLLPAGTAPGSYYMLFVADYQNTVSETNEANNVASVAITVAAPSVDLVVQQAQLSSTSTTAGSTLGMSCAVLNQGTTTAAGSSVGFYWSADAVLDANDQLLTSAFGGSLTPGYLQYRSVTATVPAGATPGTYYVIFKADPQNQVGETNENNNTAAVAVTLVTPSPDLLVSQAQLSQYSVGAGASINATAMVYNQGNTAAAANGMGVYLSTDVTLSANDQLLATASVPALGAGLYQYVYPQLTIPTGTAAGSYYVLFVADYQNQVTETNEANNVRSVGLTVAVPSVDLVMQQAYLGSYQAVAGSTVSASSYIYNQGNTTAASSNVGYYLSSNTTLDASDVLLGNTAGGSLSAGGYSSRYASLTVPASTAAGQYYVLFVADYLNQVSETNETNNVSSTTLSVVAAGVDLTLNQPYLSRTSVSAGGSVTASVYIYNMGTTAALSSSVGYYLSTNTTLDANDALLGSSTGGYLYASDYNTRSAMLTVPANTTVGSYYVLFVADYQNAVNETNETNNVVSQPLTVTAPFSGTVVPFSGTNTITTCNTTVYDHGGTDDYSDSANGTLVINPGTAGSKVQLTFSQFVVETCCDRLYIYDGPSTSSPLIGSYVYNPGTITATNSSGSLTLRFTTDGSVVAAGFQASVACVTGGSTPLPDLLPSQPYTSSSTVTAGGVLYLTTLISNQGQNTASSSAVGYFLSTNTTYDANDVALGTGSGGALGANITGQRGGTFAVPAGMPAGAYYLLHVADPYNVVSESNETNNVVYNTLLVTGSGLPDLTWAQSALSAATAAAGANVTATYQLTNQGGSTAASSYMGFYLSTDAVWSSSDVLMAGVFTNTLNAGAATATSSVQLAIPTATAAGNYYVLFVADQYGAVSESNEANNVVARALAVTRPQSTRDEQLNGLTLRVYPNPVAGRAPLTVHLDGPARASVADLSLYDALGRQVSQQALPLTGRPAYVDTQALPTGVYVLRLTGAGLNATRRVVVE